jgi:adenine-specific DNA-methyltransferase
MTELIWDGKYDKDGRKVVPLRIALPFQTVETVNESARERQRSLDLFSSGRDTAWRNRLIWGDKKYVLAALVNEMVGTVNLIYIDPPFATGQDFSFRMRLDGQDFVKEPSLIEMKAYRDTWGAGLDTYVQWFYEMVIALHETLAETGSLYVHVGPGVSHYVKAVLDEVFGRERFRTEVIWKRSTAHSDTKQGRAQYGQIHDTILFYTKSDTWIWNPVHTPYDETYVAGRFVHSEADGRRYKDADLTAAKPGGDTSFGWRVKAREGSSDWEADVENEWQAGRPGWVYREVFPPPGRYWAYSRDNFRNFNAEGRLYYTSEGTPRLKQYADQLEGISLQDVWTDIYPINSQAFERLGYPTQKPETLLERIIRASSNEGDLVLDCVCGSGTTAVVAEKLGRRWIAADLSRFAIHTARKRLLAIPDVRPFAVQNLGKYERQLWQAAEFGAVTQARTTAYRRFIIAAFKARPIEGYVWLHGIKEGRLVHVGTVDAPVTVGDVKQIAAEFGKATGKGKDAPTSKAVDVLGWDFAFELNEVARQSASRAGIDMRFWRIPREVLDKRAVEQGDIRFFELAALGLDVKCSGRQVTLRLTDFVIPLDDVPEEIQRAITDWSQWVDYWAVDWDNKGDAFHNQWQTYRTKKGPAIEKAATHEYDQGGKYQVVAKVIDILGNDTTKTLTVEVQ